MKPPVVLLSSILLYFSSSFLYAQVFSDKAARYHFPEAEVVRMAKDQERPQYIRLAPDVYVEEDHILPFFNKRLLNDDYEKLRFKTVDQDQLGMSHYRYEQYVSGYKVIGSYYMAHCADGKLRSFNGEIYDIASPDVAPKLAVEEALTNALLVVPSEQYAWEANYAFEESRICGAPAPTLVWVPVNLDFASNNFRLAYQVEVYSLVPLKRVNVYVDAITGTILAEESRMHNTDTPGVARTAMSGRREIITDQVSPGFFRLREEGRNIRTLNLNNSENYASAVDFTDDDNDWNNINGQLDQYATDTHWGAEVYFDLLQSKGRHSIDNSGHPLTSYVHYGYGVGNAFWDGNVALFGDGDGFIFDKPLVSIEIVGHEFTHGLIDYTASLIYADESGALNESFADIFGLVTNVTGRGEAFLNWRIGAEVTADGEGIRSFEDPNLFDNPGTYRGDLWVDGAGVHTNSSVQNHWFYLLTAGEVGTNELGTDYDITGQGWRTTFDIAFRNLTVYLGPSSNYEDAAFYGIQCAADLFGGCSDVFVECAQAWHAVGLGVEMPEVPTARFGINANLCELPVEATFLNSSALMEGAIWDFGDGATSTENSPVHIYTEPGRYVVTLDIIPCMDDSNGVLSTSQVINIDPESTVCDTTIMASNGELTLTSCAGVILDPGGLGSYDNNEFSILHLLPSSGNIILNFPFFQTETGFDELIIYDGPDTDSPLIGRYDGTILQNQTIISSANALTLVFDTDGSVVTDGFIIEYSVEGSSDTLEAGFTTNSTNYWLSEPILITNTSANTIVSYDFGDGTIVFGEPEAPHRYTEEGTYTIQQIVSNCEAQDTAFTSVTVAPGGSFDITPDSICVTLLSGNDTIIPLTLSNMGPGDLYYEAIPEITTFSESSELAYRVENRTNHQFVTTGLNIGGGRLTVTISGDFNSIDEFATLFIEGEDFGNIGDQDFSPDGEDIMVNLSLTEAQLDNWLVDEQLDIEIINSPTVDIFSGGIHKVELDLDVLSFVPTIPEGIGLITAADEQLIELPISAVDLSTGTYESEVQFFVGDPNQPLVAVYVKLIVEAPPSIQIGIDSELSCDGRVILTDESLNDPTSWLWDFGNGDTSTVQNLLYQYTESGLYTISLTACNEIGCNTSSIQVEVDLERAFCEEVVMGINGSEVVTSCAGTLYDNGGELEDYDNNVEYTVTIQRPENEYVELLIQEFRTEGCCDHLYIHDGPSTNSPLIGRYSGRGLIPGQTITSEANSLTLFFDTDQSVVNPGFIIQWQCQERVVPVASFTMNRNPDCPNEVQFINNSSDGENYEWDFGDGIRSTEASPVHAFSAAGNYSVTLSVANSFGTDSVTDEVNITATDIPFTVELDIPDSVRVNSLATLSFSTSQSLIGQEWDLGNGETSTSREPMVRYNEVGPYTIFLTATDENGCSVMVSKTIQVINVVNVESVNGVNNYVIYPNPTDGRLNLDLELDQVAGHLQLEIFSAQGKRVLQQIWTNQRIVREQLDLMNLPAGMCQVVFYRNGKPILHNRVVVSR